MRVIKNRSRLIFSEFTSTERKMIEQLVSTMNNIFIFHDQDKQKMYLPPGVEDSIRKLFPRVAIEDESSEYWPFKKAAPAADGHFEPRSQVQIDCIDFALKNAKDMYPLLGFILGPGTGKAIPNSTAVPTPTSRGYTKMGELQVGDLVFGSNGQPIEVLAVYPQGERDIYQITFQDGRSSLCDLEHLWSVLNCTGQKEVLTTAQLMPEPTAYKIPTLSAPLQYKSGVVPMDPYILGAWLGDHGPTIAESYLYNDLHTRLKLLQGLLTNHATVDDNFVITYTPAIPELLEQVRDLIWSIGYQAKIKENKVIVNVPNEFKTELFTNPFKQSRANAIKAFSHPNAQEFKYLGIQDIKFSHREEATCIRVDSLDSLYVIDQCILTHNTFVASYCAVKVGAKALFIAPTSSTRNQWTETLVNMLKVSPSAITTATTAREFIAAKTDYVVTLQATLANINNNYDLERILKDKQFGIKIIDECQMFFQNIIKVDGSANIAHNWYLTGTFGRSADVENKIYHEMFGKIKLFTVPDRKPTLFNRKPGNIYGEKPHMNVDMYWMDSGITEEQAESMRRATRYGISLPLYTEMVIPSDGTETIFIKKVLKIIKTAERKTPYGSTLILVPTIKSTEVLARHVRKSFPDKKVGTYHSHNDKKENARAKAEDDILISTVKSAGTGFDRKGLAKLIVLEQFKSWILTTQVAGRLRRRDDGRETYMYDIVDRNIKQLRAWGSVRGKLLKKLSKKFTLIEY